MIKEMYIRYGQNLDAFISENIGLINFLKVANSDYLICDDYLWKHEIHSFSMSDTSMLEVKKLKKLKWVSFDSKNRHVRRKINAAKSAIVKTDAGLIFLTRRDLLKCSDSIHKFVII